MYYYRVRGQNEWGYGPYSNVAVVSVFPPSQPEMHPIDNADGDGTYTVRWGLSLGALGYILVEATTPDFTHNVSYYGTGPQYRTFTDKAPATYYYKVMGQGYHDYSAWSNVVSVIVLPTGTLHMNVAEE